MSRRNVVELATIPPLGLSILVNGQRFDLVGHEDHRKQDGTSTTLLVWHGECATCGEGFVSRTSGTRWAALRRCEQHRQPGKRVQPDRYQPISAERLDDPVADLGHTERHSPWAM